MKKKILPVPEPQKDFVSEQIRLAHNRVHDKNKVVMGELLKRARKRLQENSGGLKGAIFSFRDSKILFTEVLEAVLYLGYSTSEVERVFNHLKFEGVIEIRNGRIVSPKRGVVKP